MVSWGEEGEVLLSFLWRRRVGLVVGFCSWPSDEESEEDRDRLLLDDAEEEDEEGGVDFCGGCRRSVRVLIERERLAVAFTMNFLRLICSPFLL